MDTFEKTPYETNPVESLEDALRAFAEGFNVLQAALQMSEVGCPDAGCPDAVCQMSEEESEADRTVFADELKAAMFRPVKPDGEDNHAPMSLYEIGIVYVPDGGGGYGINSRRMKTALKKRAADVRATFVQEDGILPNLCEILAAFLENEADEYVYAAALRFLNECRRLTAMWE